MKRMVYIIIAIMALVLCVVVFVGCSQGHKGGDKQLTGVSLTCSHMDYGQCYSFYLRQEEGVALFDADVLSLEDEKRIVLESKEVSADSLEKLFETVKEQGIEAYVQGYKEKPDLFFADDKTSKKITLYYSDGSDKSAPPEEDNEVLYEFFLALAREYGT